MQFINIKHSQLAWRVVNSKRTRPLGRVLILRGRLTKNSVIIFSEIFGTTIMIIFLPITDFTWNNLAYFVFFWRGWFFATLFFKLKFIQNTREWNSIDEYEPSNARTIPQTDLVPRLKPQAASWLLIVGFFNRFERPAMAAKEPPRDSLSNALLFIKIGKLKSVFLRSFIVYSL